MKLYEIPTELDTLLVEYNGADTSDERRLELEATLESLEMQIQRKADAIAHYVEQFAAEAEQVQQEINRLEKLRDHRQNRAESLKRYLSNQLQRLGLSELETTLHRFTFRHSESIQISSDAEVPIEYCTPIPASLQPQKALLKQALQQGVEIKGVRIEKKIHLQIR